MKIVACAFLSILLTALFSGCTTEVIVYQTKPWEGHYFTVQDFTNKTSNIILDRNESIWVISNHTLKQILEKTQQGK